MTEPIDQINLAASIDVNSDAIVSKTLRKSAQLNLTLFAFDTGQSLSSHASPMDAYVHVLEGELRIEIGSQSHTLVKGELIQMPANVPHALEALAPTKMLLSMVQPDSQG